MNARPLFALLALALTLTLTSNDVASAQDVEAPNHATGSGFTGGFFQGPGFGDEIQDQQWSDTQVNYAQPIGGGDEYTDWAGYGGIGYTSSTAAEGAARGAAAVIGASGYAAEKYSRAAINYETAESMDLDNQYKVAETFWAKRALWREQMATWRSPPLSYDQLQRVANQAAPDRLSASQLSPASGYVDWPAALRSPAYDSARQQLEKLFVSRQRGTTESDAPLHTQVVSISKTMQQQLRKDIHRLTPQDYMAAKGFLKSLSHEASFPVQTENLVSN
ncbi:MAG: hypothetical protein SGJ20_04760 [Planctomycetota bacterium]|nr:hypothetical protein [Planctomycetota bacterium]